MPSNTAVQNQDSTVTPAPELLQSLTGRTRRAWQYLEAGDREHLTAEAYLYLEQLERAIHYAAKLAEVRHQQTMNDLANVFADPTQMNIREVA